MAERSRIKVAALVTALFIAALIVAGVSMRSTTTPNTASAVAPVASRPGPVDAGDGEAEEASTGAEHSVEDDDE